MYIEYNIRTLQHLKSDFVEERIGHNFFPYYELTLLHNIRPNVVLNGHAWGPLWQDFRAHKLSTRTFLWNYARKDTLVYAEHQRESDKTFTSRRWIERSHANSATKSTRAISQYQTLNMPKKL